MDGEPDASIEEADESTLRRDKRGANDSTEESTKKYWWVIEKENPPRRRIPERFSLPLIVYRYKVAMRVLLHIIGIDWKFTTPQLTRIDDLLQRKRIAKRKLKRYSRFRRRIIAVFNSKGGAGKSPTIAHLLASVRKIMGLIPLLIDMNQNFGKTLINLLRPGTSLGMKEAIEKSSEFSDEFLDRRAGLSARGKVQIIVSEDIDDQIATDDSEWNVSISREIWGEVIRDPQNADKEREELETIWLDKLRDKQRERQRKLYRDAVDRIRAVAVQAGKFRKLIGIDTGNGMSHPANQAAMEIADALLFVGLWSDKEALGGIGDTIWGYFRRKFFYKISQRGFIVIIGVPSKVTKQQVFDRLGEEIFQALHNDHDKVKDPAERTRLIGEYMRNLCITPERLFIIPFSKHIAKRQLISGKTKIIGLEAKVAYMELMVSIYEIEILKDKIQENTPESFEEAFQKLVSTMDQKYTSQISEDTVGDPEGLTDSIHLKEVTP